MIHCLQVMWNGKSFDISLLMTFSSTRIIIIRGMGPIVNILRKYPMNIKQPITNNTGRLLFRLTDKLSLVCWSSNSWLSLVCWSSNSWFSLVCWSRNSRSFCIHLKAHLYCRCSGIWYNFVIILDHRYQKIL